MSKAKMVIGIEVNGQKLVLDEKSARDVYEVLHGIFGPKVEITYPVVSPYIDVAPPQWTPYTYSGTSSAGIPVDGYPSSCTNRVTIYEKL